MFRRVNNNNIYLKYLYQNTIFSLLQILPTVRLTLQLPKPTATTARSASGGVYEPDYLEVVTTYFQIQTQKDNNIRFQYYFSVT